MSAPRESPIAPYRLLFPCGLLFGALGGAVWVAPELGLALGAPTLVHPDLMVCGFLWSFAVGFLLTAVPKYFGSFAATRGEVALVTALALGMLACGLEADRTAFHALFLGQLALVGVFGARRLRHRRVLPAPIFLFVAIGLACGATGGALLLLADLGRASVYAAHTGRILLHQGMMPAMVLGVGSGLLTAILGWGQPEMVKLIAKPPTMRERRLRAWRDPVALLALFVGGLVLEALGHHTAGRALRAAALTYVGATAWRLYRPARAPGPVVAYCWLSAVLLVGSLWAYALVPGVGAHVAHAGFLGGLALLTLMVAARIALAHGGHGVGLERTLRPLGFASVLVLLAAATRVLAPYTGPAYMSHLAYAGVLWIAALGVWSMGMLPRLVRLGPPREAA